MTASSKIVLLLIVLLTGVLVLYYGVLSGGGADSDLNPSDTANDVADASIAGRDDDTSPRIPDPPRDRDQPGFAGRDDQPLLPEPGDDRDDSRPGASDEHADEPRDAPADSPTGEGEPLGPQPLTTDADDDLLPPIYSDDLTADAESNEDASTGAPDDDPDDRADDRDDTPDALTPPQYTEYVVKENESLWTIAATWFGDGSKWDLIARANPSIDPQHLRVGMVLRLPPKDAERPTSSPEPADDDDVVRYVVQSGDSLTRIARVYYGDVSLWNRIYEANRETIGDRPENLRPGMELTIPPPPSP